ncbi:MAG TPA: hypothetical protein VNN55_00660 [bacterium]|nr:hypothetical protein [bacterium]
MMIAADQSRPRLVPLLRALGWLCVVVVLLSPPAAHAGAAVIRDTTLIVGADSPGPYWVSGFYLVGGRASVSLNGAPIDDYTLDPDNGRIRFARALAPTDTAQVIFDRLGFALASRWTRSPDGISEASDATIRPAAFQVPQPSSPLRAPASVAQLQWQGYKSFSVSASDAAATDWSQGLELTVSGELLRGLPLSAALSDRQVNAQSGRSLRDGSRLGDLDRFFIEAQSAKFHGRWGELKLQQSGQVTRCASGMQTAFHVGGHAVETHVARLHGERRHAQIVLRDGELGPYTLAADGAGAAIVDGSVDVWLDGAALTEGRDADFTVDPARGTLTLSPRVQFSGRSQLTVEYEAALDSYQRSLAGGAWSWRSDDSSRAGRFALSWEGDDPDQPLTGALTDTQRDILARDPDGKVQVPAIERVGDHEGDYRLELRDGDSVFVYAGPDQGDHRVRFTWTGEKQGRYRHVIDDVYEYVGPGRGNYDPLLRLAAATAQLTLDESLRLRTGRLGRWRLDWQGMAIDPNRFAAKTSYLRSNHQLGWSLGDSVTSRSRLAMDWTHQFLRSTARPLGPTAAAFANLWRLPTEVLDGAFDTYSANAATPLAGWLDVAGDAAILRQSNLSGYRAGGAIDAAPTRWLALQQSLQMRRVDEQNAARATTRVSESLLRLRPAPLSFEAGVHEEDIRDPDRVLSASAADNSARWLAAAFGDLTIRHEWRRAERLDRPALERTREFSLGIPARFLHASAGSGLTLRRGALSVDGGEARPYYGARLGAVWAPRAGLQVAVDADLAHRRAGAQREVFLPTRPGQGDYRFERGEYVPDPQGDYRRVWVDDEANFAAAYDAARAVQLSWRPRWRAWRIALESARRVDARYDADRFSPGRWLLPWEELNAALLADARLSARDDHRLTLQPRARTRLSLALMREKQVFNRAAANDESRLWRVDSDWREQLSRAIYLSGGLAYERRTRAALAPLDADARTIAGTVGATPWEGVGLSLETRRRFDRELARGDNVTLWAIHPAARIARGALSATFASDFTWVAGVASGLLSPLLAEGRPPGFSVTESAEIRLQLPGRISFNARLSGDHRPDASDRWRIHLESIATF